jgi:hypothetical protein
MRVTDCPLSVKPEFRDVASTGKNILQKKYLFDYLAGLFYTWCCKLGLTAFFLSGVELAAG